ncbi:MAG: ribonuclease R [Francisellaceae bacterium]
MKKKTKKFKKDSTAVASSHKYSVENDPNRVLEAQKYEHPIPSREVILNYLQDLKFPTTFDNIAGALKLYKSAQLPALKNRLSAMVRDDQLTQSGLYYRLPHYIETIISGKVIIAADGSATVNAKDSKLSARLSAQQMKLVFDNDIVSARVLGINSKDKLEAHIDNIISRNTQTVVGRLHLNLDGYFVKPISKTNPHTLLLLPPKLKLEPGTLIDTRIILQPSSMGPAVAEFIEIIEEESPVFEAISLASKKHNLPEKWRKATLNATAKLPKKVTSDEAAARIDLKELPFVTIDGEDARDFDDAVFAHKSSTGGFKLYVAIADVSHYVRAGKAIDTEAQLRSTSVYFPGFVIPMLPEALSNELCSLKPKVNRLALVCEMNISKKGELTRYKFYSAVIESKARLTYTQVAKLLHKKDNDIYEKNPDLIPHLFDLYELYQILHQKRQQRGAIDFDTVETQILLDQHKHIKAIVPRARNDAHRLIEECMLMANVATAKFLAKHKTQAPYRIHEAPKAEKVQDLNTYLKAYQLHIPIKGKVQPADFSQMLESAKVKADFHNIQLITLKSMNQAVYSPDNIGHFGLAYDAYTHFTSPIRRYPDLIVHRAIKAIINEERFGGHIYAHNKLGELCDYASTQERNADSASMDVEKWLKCHFMHPHIGDIFDGKIVHVAGFGLFVELCDNFIEGLVHVSSIRGDYYIFDDIHHRLIGERHRKIYAIGDKIRVRLVRVDMESLQIDFDIVEDSSVEANYLDKSIELKRPISSKTKHGGKSSPRRKKPKRQPLEATEAPKEEAKKNKTKRRTKKTGKSNARTHEE